MSFTTTTNTKTLSAKKIDVFVHCHGYFSNNKIYPIEIGLSEVDNYQQTRIIISDLSELPCSSTDYENNFVLHKNIHGIDGPFFFKEDKEGNNRRYGTPFKYLGACIKLLYPRGTVFATKGSSQRLMFQEIVKDYYNIIDIEEDFGLRNKIPVDQINSPNLHRGFHNHNKEHEMNCAGKIAWTYAKLLRDKIKFFDLWPVTKKTWEDSPIQEKPKFTDEPYWEDDDNHDNDDDYYYNDYVVNDYVAENNVADNNVADNNVAEQATTTTTTQKEIPDPWDV